jgi:hypothetical protein
MAYRQKGFPMHAGISPMRQDKVDDTDTDIATAQEKERVRLETERLTHQNNIKAMDDQTGVTIGKTNTTNTSTNGTDLKESDDAVTAETKKQALRDAWRNTGGGHIYAAGESIVKGIKNMRAKRKARKGGELTDAQAAVTGGTANLKQTKLVDKTNDKTTKATAKATKDKAKDDAKLAKYNAKKAK